ncbi:MAG: aspartate aminotransferase family protein, partial [Armatimonadetes bacterium CG07_land_8_20_14_0_80_40_9]
MNEDEITKLEKKFIITTYTREEVIFTKGKGVYLYDQQGNKYLDFLSGISVCSLGHCHPKVVSAIKNQAKKLIHTSNLYYTIPQIRLANILFELTGGMRAFFCNSGAEANEAAIKLARRWADLEKKEGYEIITALGSFHGRTLATLAATGQEKYQKGYEPLMPGFKYVPFNDLNALQKAISAKTIAIILEPVQGEGGVYPAELKYLQGARRLSEEGKTLLILDEVQAGLGRCGKMFAYEDYKIKPDILTLAKSIAGGIPMGIMLAREDIASCFKPGDHGSTFGGTPLACAASLAVLKVIREERLAESALNLGKYFIKKLKELKERHKIIKE